MSTAQGLSPGPLVDGHLELELLSAYLDREIDEPERPPVEAHLEACLSCQHRLDGLRRVVDGVHRLERAAPPPVLDTMVKRHIVLEREGSGIASRWSSGRRWGGGLSSQVGIMFALVFALAVILFLFSSALERQTEPILVPVIDTFGSPREVVLSSRTFVREPHGYREQGSSQSSSRSVAFGSEAAQALLAAEPDLEGLLDEGPLTVLIAGESIEILPPGRNLAP